MAHSGRRHWAYCWLPQLPKLGAFHAWSAEGLVVWRVRSNPSTLEPPTLERERETERRSSDQDVASKVPNNLNMKASGKTATTRVPELVPKFFPHDRHTAVSQPSPKHASVARAC